MKTLLNLKLQRTKSVKSIPNHQQDVLVGLILVENCLNPTHAPAAKLEEDNVDILGTTFAIRSINKIQELDAKESMNGGILYLKLDILVALILREKTVLGALMVRI